MQSILYTFLFLLHVSFITANLPVQLVCDIHNTTCLLAEARDMFGQIVEGYAPLHTEPLDPLFIGFVHIEGEYKFDSRDMQAYGLKKAIIEDVSVDFTTKIVRLKFATDFTFKSHYINSGRILSTDIEGAGNFLMKFHNVHIDLMMSFDIIKDAFDNDVMMLNKYTYTSEVKDGAEYTFDNLYKGSKAESNAMHKLLNENWESLTKEFGKYALNPVTDKVFNAIRLFTRARPLKEYFVY